MAAEHANRTELFDLKHDVGGMVDIEFAVQYIVLAHAHAHPQLTRNAGNIALLRMAADAQLLAPVLARAGCGCLSRLSSSAASDPDDRRPACARRPRAAGSRRDVVDALWTAVLGAPRERRRAAT